MIAAQYVEIVSSIAVALAASFGACVAFKGLSIWRQQTQWHEDNDLAKRMLSAVYDYRDAVQRFRRSYLNAEESNLYEGVHVDEGNAFDRVMKKMEPVFALREEALVSKSTKMAAIVEEARFLWGDKLPDCFIDVFNSKVEISNFLRTYFGSLPNMKESLREAIYEQLLTMQGVINENFDEDCKRKADLLSKVEEIESFLRAKIGRGK